MCFFEQKIIHNHFLSSLKDNADTPTLRSVQAKQNIYEVSYKADNWIAYGKHLNSMMYSVV